MQDQVNLSLVPGTNINLTKSGSTVVVDCTYDDSSIQDQIDQINEDLETYSTIANTGRYVALELNSTTYELVAKLRDANNNVISTSNTIDLPIESLIMSITYDSSTNELVITYKDGSVVRVPISSIITGVEMQANKTTVINSSSTDTQYPSAKATYDTFVKFTDYATSSTGGVLKTDATNYATSVQNGILKCETKTYPQYQNYLYNSAFISKGTLENVLANRLGPIDDVLDAINGESV